MRENVRFIVKLNVLGGNKFMTNNVSLLNIKGTVTKESEARYSIDDLKKEVIKQLGNDLSLPIDACDVIFDNVEIAYGNKVNVGASMEMVFHCSVGYAGTDIYTEYEDVYSEEFHCYYKVPVTKNRQLYRWSPYNGRHIGKYFANFTEGYEINDINSFLEEHMVEFITQNSYRIEKHLSIPGDVWEDFDIDSISCGDADISITRFPVYKTIYTNNQNKSYEIVYDSTDGKFLVFEKPFQKERDTKPQNTDEINDLEAQRNFLNSKYISARDFPQKIESIHIALRIALFFFYPFSIIGVIIGIICAIKNGIAKGYKKKIKIVDDQLKECKTKLYKEFDDKETEFKNMKKAKLAEVLEKYNYSLDDVKAINYTK